jgi:phosphoglycolate phosphatase
VSSSFTSIDVCAQTAVEPTGSAARLDLHTIRLVLFDLDGTLVDSVGDLAWCANAMLRQLNLPARDDAAVLNWVGNGLERLVKRVLTGEMEAEPDPALFARGLSIYRELYARHACDHCVVYPGVIDTLQALTDRGLKLACVTNKPEPFTSQLIAAMGLERYFELVVAGDTTARKKPDPLPLHYAADHFGYDYADCLMVGDSSNDVLAARAAGFAAVGVPYGYNHGEDIRNSSPDLVVDNLFELVNLFSREKT